MKRTALLAVLPMLLVPLAGCGDDDPKKETSQITKDAGSAVNAEPAGGLPACDTIWAEGKTLPADYEGCDDNGTVVDITFTPCEDGKTSLRKHQTAAGENTFVAITGQAIQTYTDEASATLYAECRPSNAG